MHNHFISILLVTLYPGSLSQRKEPGNVGDQTVYF